MKFTEYLFKAVEDIWKGYLEHPFVLEMAQGILDVEKFKYYMLQDYVYLRDYIKVFALSLIKSNDFKTMIFLCDSMYATLNEVERVHVPYMKRLHITQEDIDNVKPHINNTSYTKYMLWEANAGDALTGLVTILSCSWSYAYIGKKMVDKYPESIQDPFFGEWFQGYCSKEYQEGNEVLLEMVDTMGENISTQERDRLIQIFANASIYEKMFWDMAYEG